MRSGGGGEITQMRLEEKTGEEGWEGEMQVTLVGTASMGNVILVLSLIVAAIIVYLAVNHWIPVQVASHPCSRLLAFSPSCPSSPHSDSFCFPSALNCRSLFASHSCMVSSELPSMPSDRPGPAGPGPGSPPGPG
eukprot:765356-Hanusia_phi.AAC.4